MKKSKKNELRYNEDDERTLLEDILDFVKVFVISAIVILLFVNFVAHPVRVDGKSMYPTLKDGEFGFTNVGGVLLNGVERGDIVVVTMEENVISGGFGESVCQLVSDLQIGRAHV